MLDGVPTAHFDDEFHALAADLDACGGLAPMRRLDGRVLVALDGTEFFRSRKVRCDNCSTRKRGDGGHGVLPPDAGRQHRGAGPGAVAAAAAGVS